MFGWLHGLVGALPGQPDLYDAIRRPEAARRADGRGGRACARSPRARSPLLAAPPLCAAGVEAALRRGGSVYVEARRA